jgi:ribosomal protein S12 methylthiotransferase
MLAAQGVRELNLIAQDLTAYGRERKDGTTLLSLLRALSKVDGIEWIRLLYCYPNHLDEPLLRYIAEEDKICSYIDMPLQHISNRMLRAMRREKSGDGIRRLLERIRTFIPDVVLRSSFIVGFPGEQEEDFQQLLDFISEVEIDRVGVFQYSQEENTTAYAMADQIAEEIKHERWQRLMERQSRVVRKKHLALVGSIQDVLVGGGNEVGRWWGRTRGQAPDIDGLVLLDRIHADVGDITPVQIIGIAGYDLRARPSPSIQQSETRPVDIDRLPL